MRGGGIECVVKDATLACNAWNLFNPGDPGILPPSVVRNPEPSTGITAKIEITQSEMSC